MTSFSSLRVRLVGTVFCAVMPAWLIMHYTHLPWTGFVVGLAALGAAWFGGERFILRQVRILYQAAQRLAAGDFTSRTGLSKEHGELGQLAQTFDLMAAALEQRGKEREYVEKTLLHRSFQQTVVGALGQFALVGNDFPALLSQVVILAAQTLEVEFCELLELAPDGRTLRLQAGVGWRPGIVGTTRVSADAGTQAGYTLTAGEPVVTLDLSNDFRFRPSPLLLEHGVVSGVTVAIGGHGRAFGLLGAHTAHHRKFNEDEVHFLFSAATLLAMVTERNRAESEWQKLAEFAQLNPNPAMEFAASGDITYANEAVFKLARSLGKQRPSEIIPANIGGILLDCLATGRSLIELPTQMSGRALNWSFHPIVARQVVHCYLEDVTDRLNLEAQLRQSQKMESVGQLAAGVAHDFNNMLTIIQGHSGMLLTKPNLPPDLLDSAQAVYFAAERAASLTRQLLMFSRKNVMQPQPLDLRDLVANMSKMLQRLLGETVALQFAPPVELPLILGDPGMLEQVLMNLAVNARDAMVQGGHLIISTTTAAFDEHYVHTHPEARPGTFVCLRVSDNGCGMDQATMSRIFEPFFTTKEVGKGTGLGLATAYGIVKQHSGWIEVNSAVGRGSSFSVFLPAQSDPVRAQVQASTAPTEVRGGEETILIVEDEDVLRQMANVILRECGYRVLEASTGHEALKVWEQYHQCIDLLLTDMVMPEGMSGMELAEQLLAAKPELKIIFASGYSVDDLDTNFLRDGHADFLQKPYTHLTLPKVVRDCLDKPRGANSVQ